jgi:DNA-binding transcriptional MerR regulator
MKEFGIKKLYYSISEVSEITSVKPYVLRYWETEFKELKPTKNRAGNRTYKHHDVQVVMLIKKLLYAEKYTVEGAKSRIAEELKRDGNQLDFTFGQNTRNEVISHLRQGLLEIKALLDH